MPNPVSLEKYKKLNLVAHHPLFKTLDPGLRAELETQLKSFSPENELSSMDRFLTKVPTGLVSAQDTVNRTVRDTINPPEPGPETPDAGFRGSKLATIARGATMFSPFNVARSIGYLRKQQPIQPLEGESEEQYNKRSKQEIFANLVEREKRLASRGTFGQLGDAVNIGIATGAVKHPGTTAGGLLGFAGLEGLAEKAGLNEAIAKIASPTLRDSADLLKLVVFGKALTGAHKQVGKLKKGRALKQKGVAEAKSKAALEAIKKKKAATPPTKSEKKLAVEQKQIQEMAAYEEWLKLRTPPMSPAQPTPTFEQFQAEIAMRNKALGIKADVPQLEHKPAPPGRPQPQGQLPAPPVFPQIEQNRSASPFRSAQGEGFQAVGKGAISKPKRGSVAGDERFLIKNPNRPLPQFQKQLPAPSVKPQLEGPPKVPKLKFDFKAGKGGKSFEGEGFRGVGPNEVFVGGKKGSVPGDERFIVPKKKNVISQSAAKPKAKPQRPTPEPPAAFVKLKEKLAKEGGKIEDTSQPPRDKVKAAAAVKDALNKKLKAAKEAGKQGQKKRKLSPKYLKRKAELESGKYELPEKGKILSEKMKDGIVQEAFNTGVPVENVLDKMMGKLVKRIMSEGGERAEKYDKLIGELVDLRKQLVPGDKNFKAPKVPEIKKKNVFEKGAAPAPAEAPPVEKAPPAAFVALQEKLKAEGKLGGKKKKATGGKKKKKKAEPKVEVERETPPPPPEFIALQEKLKKQKKAKPQNVIEKGGSEKKPGFLELAEKKQLLGGKEDLPDAPKNIISKPKAKVEYKRPLTIDEQRVNGKKKFAVLDADGKEVAAFNSQQARNPRRAAEGFIREQDPAVGSFQDMLKGQTAKPKVEKVVKTGKAEKPPKFIKGLEAAVDVPKDIKTLAENYERLRKHTSPSRTGEARQPQAEAKLQAMKRKISQKIDNSPSMKKSSGLDFVKDLIKDINESLGSEGSTGAKKTFAQRAAAKRAKEATYNLLARVYKKKISLHDYLKTRGLTKEEIAKVGRSIRARADELPKELTIENLSEVSGLRREAISTYVTKGTIPAVITKQPGKAARNIIKKADAIKFLDSLKPLEERTTGYFKTHIKEKSPLGKNRTVKDQVKDLRDYLKGKGAATISDVKDVKKGEAAGKRLAKDARDSILSLMKEAKKARLPLKEYLKKNGISDVDAKTILREASILTIRGKGAKNVNLDNMVRQGIIEDSSAQEIAGILADNKLAFEHHVLSRKQRTPNDPLTRQAVEHLLNIPEIARASLNESTMVDLVAVMNKAVKKGIPQEKMIPLVVDTALRHKQIKTMVARNMQALSTSNVPQNTAAQLKAMIASPLVSKADKALLRSLLKGTKFQKGKWRRGYDAFNEFTLSNMLDANITQSRNVFGALGETGMSLIDPPMAAAWSKIIPDKYLVEPRYFGEYGPFLQELGKSFFWSEGKSFPASRSAVKSFLFSNPKGLKRYYDFQIKRLIKKHKVSLNAEDKAAIWGKIKEQVRRRDAVLMQEIGDPRLTEVGLSRERAISSENLGLSGPKEIKDASGNVIGTKPRPIINAFGKAVDVYGYAKTTSLRLLLAMDKQLIEPQFAGQKAMARARIRIQKMIELKKLLKKISKKELAEGNFMDKAELEILKKRRDAIVKGFVEGKLKNIDLTPLQTEAARQNALYYAYRREMGTKFGKSVMSFLSNTPGFNLLLRFAATRTNMLKNWVDRSPAGFAFAVKNPTNPATGVKEIKLDSLQLAKATNGLILYALGRAAMKKEGWSFHPPATSTAEREARRTVNIPAGMYMQKGDKVRSTQNIIPYSGFAAAMTYHDEMERKLKLGKNKEQIIKDGNELIFRSIIENSTMYDVQQLSRIMDDSFSRDIIGGQGAGIGSKRWHKVVTGHLISNAEREALRTGKFWRFVPLGAGSKPDINVYDAESAGEAFRSEGLFGDKTDIAIRKNVYGINARRVIDPSPLNPRFWKGRKIASNFDSISNAKLKAVFEASREVESYVQFPGRTTKGIPLSNAERKKMVEYMAGQKVEGWRGKIKVSLLDKLYQVVNSDRYKSFDVKRKQRALNMVKVRYLSVAYFNARIEAVDRLMETEAGRKQLWDVSGLGGREVPYSEQAVRDARKWIIGQPPVK